MSDSLSAIPAASYDGSVLAGSWVALNGSGFAEPIKILKIYNGGASGIDISLDGVTKHDFLPAGGTFILDCQANHENIACAPGTLNGRKGQIIYGRASSTSTYIQIAGYK